MRRRRRRFLSNEVARLLLIVFAVFSVSEVAGRDFMERPAAIAPGPPPDGFSLLSTLYGEFAYHIHAFSDSETDTFQLRNTAHFGIVDVGSTRFGIYYGTFLLSGPVDDESAKGSDLAPWLMNAVQFEYGVSGRITLGMVDLVGDYGRRSYHPLRRRFTDPATDILRAGVLVPERPIGKGSFSGALRVRWSQLFDFWGSDIPNPRATWAFQPAVEYRRPLLTRSDVDIGAFAVAMADLLLLEGGTPDSDLAGQIGVAISGGEGESGGKIEGFLDMYRSSDTEERETQKTPVSLAGLGFRIVFEL